MGGNDETIAATLAQRFSNQLKFSSADAARTDVKRLFGSISSSKDDIAERHDHYLDDTTRE